MPAAAAVFVACAVPWATIAGRSLWFDEAFSWRLSTFPVGELLVRAARDNNPPLYYLLLKGWSAVLGESPAALRSLSVVAAAATAVGVWLFVREAWGTGRPHAPERPQAPGARPQEDDSATASPPTGDGSRSGDAAGSPQFATWASALAAALVATGALHVHWAQEARMYTLAAALAAWSSWAMFRAIRAGTLRAWSLYALLAALFAYTHTYALFSLVAQGVFVAGWLAVGGFAVCRGQRRRAEQTGTGGASGTQSAQGTAGQAGGRPDSRLAGIAASGGTQPPERHAVRSLRGQASGGTKGTQPPERHGGRSLQGQAGSGTQPPERHAVRSLQGPVLAAALVAAAYAPWLPVFVRQHAQVKKEYFLARATIEDVCYAMWFDALYPYGGSTGERRAAALFSLVVLVSLVWRPGRGGWSAALYTLLAAGGPWAMAIAVSRWDTNVFALRFLLFAHTFLLVALAVLVARIPRRFERIVATAVLLAGMAWITFEHLRAIDPRDRPGTAAAMRLIDQRRGAHEPVIVSSPMYFYAALYHSPRREDIWLYERPSVHVHYFGSAVLRREELIDDAALARLDAPRAWVVNTQGGGWGHQAVPVPPHWRRVAEHRFPEVYYIQGEVVVVEYAVSPRPD